MADYSKPARQQMAAKGKAIPDKPTGGKFPIDNRSDLESAIKLAGQVDDDQKVTVRRYIMKRAKALGLESLIPDSWQENGSVSTGSGPSSSS